VTRALWIVLLFTACRGQIDCYLVWGRDSYQSLRCRDQP